MEEIKAENAVVFAGSKIISSEETGSIKTIIEIDETKTLLNDLMYQVCYRSYLNVNLDAVYDYLSGIYFSVPLSVRSCTNTVNEIFVYFTDVEFYSKIFEEFLIETFGSSIVSFMRLESVLNFIASLKSDMFFMKVTLIYRTEKKDLIEFLNLWQNFDSVKAIYILTSEQFEFNHGTKVHEFFENEGQLFSKILTSNLFTHLRNANNLIQMKTDQFVAKASLDQCGKLLQILQQAIDDSS